MKKELTAILLCIALLCLGCAAFSETKVGSVISFGHYEQDNDTSNGPEEILWYVIDIQGNDALLLSGYGLDVRKFDGKTWDKCGLRNWLNSTFKKEAFDDEEKARIVDAMLSTPGNDAYDKPGGDDTIDSVFVLSREQFMKYLNVRPYSKMAETAATPYAQSKTDEKYLSYWWLRTPASHRDEDQIMVVSFGNLSDLGWDAKEDKKVMVRPSLWIRIDE